MCQKDFNCRVATNNNCFHICGKNVITFKGPYYTCGKMFKHIRGLITFVEVFTFRGPTYEPRHEKTWFNHNANNKGADQPAHPRSLISTFVVHYLDSIIPILAKSKFSRLYLVSVAEQAGLSHIWSQTPKTGFLVKRLIWYWPRAYHQKRAYTWLITEHPKGHRLLIILTLKPYEPRHEKTCLRGLRSGKAQTGLHRHRS